MELKLHYLSKFLSVSICKHYWWFFYQAEQHFLKHNDAGSWIQDSALMLSMSKEVPWYLVRLPPLPVLVLLAWKIHCNYCFWWFDEMAMSKVTWGLIFIPMSYIDFKARFKGVTAGFFGTLSGWWDWSCICSGSSWCHRFCIDCWKWSVWRIGTISCTWNIRLPARPQGFSCTIFFIYARRLTLLYLCLFGGNLWF